MTAWELQAGKCHIRRCQASIQGTGVVRLRGWNLLGGDFVGPERVGFLGLLDAFLGDVSVGPAAGGVSIQLGPIALSSFMRSALAWQGDVFCWSYIPGRGPVESLGNVVIAFSVSTHIEYLVLNMTTALMVQASNLMLESLPLSLFVSGIEFLVGLVGAADQTKVHGRLRVVVLSAGLGPRRTAYMIGHSHSRRSRHWWWDHLEGRSQ